MWKLLRVLEVQRNVILESSSYQLSLAETERKQNEGCGLTHITNEAYEFFLLLASKASALDNIQNLHRHGSKLFLMVFTNLQNDEVLLQKWFALFSLLSADSLTEDEDDLMSSLVLLFEEIVHHYLKIVHATLRKNFKETASVKKTKALRTNIAVPSTSGQEAKKRKTASQAFDEAVDTSVNSDTESYPCPVCKDECIDDPIDLGDQSIECAKCKKWLHYKCCDITGTERFLKSVYAKWICKLCKIKPSPCKKSGKSKQSSKNSGKSKK